MQRLSLRDHTEWSDASPPGGRLRLEASLLPRLRYRGKLGVRYPGAVSERSSREMGSAKRLIPLNPGGGGMLVQFPLPCKSSASVGDLTRLLAASMDLSKSLAFPKGPPGARERTGGVRPEVLFW